MTVEAARLLARYNQWMNQRLYAICAEFPDAERKRDTGTFFRSMHGVLNHLLLTDRAWLGRFTGVPFPVTTLDQDLYPDFDDLRREREITDGELLKWADALTPEALAGTVRYRMLSRPVEREDLLWVAATHLFNHQAHHRGQLTTLIFQAGSDSDVTDLMWMPGIPVPPTEA
jgi:uncharacterized damage-inducible protein DinB